MVGLHNSPSWNLAEKPFHNQIGLCMANFHLKNPSLSMWGNSLPPSLLPAWCPSSWLDGRPAALEEFSWIITAFSAIYCCLNPDVCQPCLMAVGSIDCLCEWYCVALMTSRGFEQSRHFVRPITHSCNLQYLINTHLRCKRRLIKDQCETLSPIINHSWFVFLMTCFIWLFALQSCSFFFAM